MEFLKLSLVEIMFFVNFWSPFKHLALANMIYTAKNLFAILRLRSLQK